MPLAHRSPLHLARNSRSSPEAAVSFRYWDGFRYRQQKRGQPVVPRRSKPTAPSPRVDDLLSGRGDPQLQWAGRPASSRRRDRSVSGGIRPRLSRPGHVRRGDPPIEQAGDRQVPRDRRLAGPWLTMRAKRRDRSSLPGLPAAPRLSPAGRGKAR